ncbi:MAG TPA: peptide chain release factor N(5)-glutamine methyltransferase [Saprospiraceae bacterium]|nr:peptide chain release factor N(5)-glutamine methyltransferase [Saprospiraceae bacterium]HMQ82091.1 peptide chain release factor N(5)-glutamine methyltransferase [Saprospiraceae bacterium]
MTIIQHIIRSLEPLYGAREALSMARIIVEDVFPRKISLEQLNSDETQVLTDILHRLSKNEPLQYILGGADFYGLRFHVNPQVLIPRPETEELVHWILQSKGSQIQRVLDIGTGSGCIAVTLKKKRPDWEVWAMDVSATALQTTQVNALANDVSIPTIQLDILENDRWTSLPLFDLVVSNPPYIPFSEIDHMGASTRMFEPQLALFVPDEDPLLFYRCIAHFCQEHLSQDGLLFLEVNEFNAPEVVALLVEKGFRGVALEKDLQGKNRMLKAQR